MSSREENMLPHAVSSEQPLLCDPKDISTPTVRVDSFSSNIYTGSQFEAVINALHVAASGGIKGSNAQ